MTNTEFYQAIAGWPFNISLLYHAYFEIINIWNWIEIELTNSDKALLKTE